MLYTSRLEVATPTPGTQVQEAQDDTPTRKHKVWEPLILEWTISVMDDLTSYTHSLVDDTGVIYGIKSTSKDIYDYTGEVSLKGKVVDIKKWTAILDVSEILQKDWWNTVENLDKNPKLTYLPQLGLMIDLWQTAGYDLKVGTSSIQISDSVGTGSQALTINPFTCTPGDGLKDCDLLLEKFGDPLNQQFTSANDITYYNMTETNTWIAINPRNVGYYFIPWEDKDISSFVDLISFMDNSKIKDSAEEFAKTACVTLDWGFDQDKELNIQLWNAKNGLINTDITWTTSQWYMIDCRLQTKLWYELEHKVLSVTIEKWDTAEEEIDIVDDTPETVPTTWEENIQNDVDNNINTEAEDTQVWIATWTSTVNSLRIRSSKDISDNILWALQAWDDVTILEIEDERLKVLFKNQEARVNKSFITIVWWEPAPTQEVENEEAPIVEENIEDIPEVIEEEATEPTEVEEEEETEEEINEDNIEEETKVSNWWTTYFSSRGYTLFFSDKNIAYDGSVSDDIAEGCIQQVNVISRKNASNVRTNPDLIIQVCPDTADDDIWTLIWTYNGDSFYLQDITWNLNMDISVSGTLEE